MKTNTSSPSPEFSKSILVDLVLMCGKVDDKALRHDIQSISKQIRFSEPVAYPGHEALDRQIKEAHQKLISLVDSDDVEDARKQCEVLKALFTQRDDLVSSMSQP
jgi:replicative DNA helicase